MTLADWERLFRRHVRLLGACVLAGALAALAVNFLAKPVYEAEILLKVDPQSGESLLATTAPAWWFDPTPLHTQVELARSKTVLERVCRKLGLAEGDKLVQEVGDLRSRVRAAMVRNTNLITVTVNDHDPVRVRDLANTIGDELVAISIESRQEESRRIREFLDSQVLKIRDDLIRSEQSLSPRSVKVNEEVYRLLLSKRHEANIAENSQIGELRVIDSAALPSRPVRPRRKFNIALGLFIGGMLGLVGAFWREQQYRGVASIEELEETTEVPVLGWVPRLKLLPATDWLSRPAELLDEHETNGRLEPYQLVVGNLELLPSREPHRTLLVTSAVPGEGKSRTVACLALAMAKNGRKVAVVEGDMRRPTLGNLWDLHGPGLADVLAGKSDLDGALRQVDSAPNFRVLPAGQPTPDPGNLLRTERLREVMKGLRERFDAVLIDSSPLLLTPDALKLAGTVDGVLVILEAEMTPKKIFTRALNQLTRTDSRLLGVILNKLPATGSSYGAYYGRYYSSKHRATSEAS